MQGPVNRPENEGNYIWIILESLFEAQVVADIIQSTNATRDFKSTGEASHHVAIALPVKLDLPRLILHELGLVATFDRPQLIGTAPGEQDACESHRREAHEQQDSQNNVQETDSSEFFEHSLGLVGLKGHPRRSCPASGFIIVEHSHVCQRVLTRIYVETADLSTFDECGASKPLSAKAREWKLWVATR